MFPTQYIPDFFVAEQCSLRNTSPWGSKDLATSFQMSKDSGTELKFRGATRQTKLKFQLTALKNS
jgi:hypothetical protein